MDLPCSRRSLGLHAGGTNPGSTASHSQCCATCDSAFPIAGQGRLLRSRSISGLFSRSLYSGLQPSCLRFAVLLPDTTQDSVRGCSLGFTAAAISGDRVQRTCTAQPAQIPAGAANAPGSSLGSNVGKQAVWTRPRSGVQPPIGSTWRVGSESEPRPPVGCSPWVRPFPPRPPPEVAFPCSVTSSVVWLIRLLIHVHARRAAYGLPEPARHTGPGMDETSQVPYKERLHVHKVSDCARFFPCKPFAMGRCCLLFSRTRSAPRNSTRFAAQYLARGLPCERFTSILANSRASLGVGMVG